MKNNFILDAKYKHGSYYNNFSEETKSSVQRADLHQLITYLHILPANSGGLIYPYDGDLEKNIIISDDSRDLYGYGGTIKTYGIKIPKKCLSYSSFAESMNKTEDELKTFNW